MDYARDLRTGKIVEAEKAVRSRSYACPRPGCRGRVYLPNVVIQRPHFRHFPGEGTPACDEYYPGTGSNVDSGPRAVAAVEEDPSELGLLLTQIDGRWGLGLRLPEIPSAEFVESSLGTLRSASVEVYSGHERLLQVSALELRPGVGSARVDVAPRLQPLRTQPAGSWPASVGKERWELEARGLEATGVLFRLRGGEWTRLRARSGVYHGETLLVLADTRCAPPSLVVSETHGRISSDSLHWVVWEIRLPSEPVSNVLAWLDRLGHPVAPRPWRIALITPPRGYSEQGDPVFWVDDGPVLVLEAPEPKAVATVSFRSGVHSYNADVQAAQSRCAHIRVSVRDPGLTRLIVIDERSASLALTFVRRPPDATLSELLDKTARLRIQIGQQVIQAWQGLVHKIEVSAREQLQVSVDLGDESARARVTVWQRRRQKSKRGLDALGVTKELEGALKSSERIEIDADNLGRVTLVPVYAKIARADENRFSSRLAWRDHVVSKSSRMEAYRTLAVLEQPRSPKSLALRHIGPAEFIRCRVALRQQRAFRGSRQ